MDLLGCAWICLGPVESRRAARGVTSCPHRCPSPRILRNLACNANYATMAHMKMLPFDETSVAMATETLKAGGVVIVPTETVYGVACHPDFPEALERIFGKNVIRIFSKVSGVILMAMAAQMIVTGFMAYLDRSVVGQKLLEALTQ